ncbi:hypothetical protein M0802_001544 [Mischocyttarus mexicanus]|nr:hypothetical protein M0802_001544 [Mischocyttarus mexicanus]
MVDDYDYDYDDNDNYDDDDDDYDDDDDDEDDDEDVDIVVDRERFVRSLLRILENVLPRSRIPIPLQMYYATYGHKRNKNKLVLTMTLTGLISKTT